MREISCLPRPLFLYDPTRFLPHPDNAQQHEYRRNQHHVSLLLLIGLIGDQNEEARIEFSVEMTIRPEDKPLKHEATYNGRFRSPVDIWMLVLLCWISRLSFIRFESSSPPFQDEKHVRSGDFYVFHSTTLYFSQVDPNIWKNVDWDPIDLFYECDDNFKHFIKTSNQSQKKTIWTHEIMNQTIVVVAYHSEDSDIKSYPSRDLELVNLTGGVNWPSRYVCQLQLIDLNVATPSAPA